MSQALRQVAREATAARPQFEEVLGDLPDQHPLILGAGIGTLLGNPVVVTGSEVSGNEQVNACPRTTVVGLGGGIAAPRSRVTIDRGAINDNSALNDGGGIWVQRGPLTMTRSAVNDNSATGDGGGIWNASALTVLDSTSVVGNRAGGDGGGLFNAAQGRAVALGSSSRGNQAAGQARKIAPRLKIGVVLGEFTDFAESAKSALTVSGPV